jgi:hypothetical protein
MRLRLRAKHLTQRIAEAQHEFRIDHPVTDPATNAVGSEIPA